MSILIGQLGQEVGRPVIQQALGVRRVDQLLHREVRHPVDHVHTGRTELAQRPQDLFALVRVTGVADDDGDDGLAAHRLGHELLGRRGDERHTAPNLVRRGEDEVAPEPRHVGCHCSRVHEHAAEHDRSDRVQPEVERGDHAEVPAAAAQPPEQVSVLVVGGEDLAPLGRDDFGLDEVVAGEAELAREPAVAAAEREACDARRRHPASGDGKTVLLGGGVELAPGETGLGAHVRASASTATPFMPRRSMQIPASTTAEPVTP